MTSIEIQLIKDILENAIVESDKMWDEKISHSQIIGYLQGNIKAVKDRLARSLDLMENR